ncbi:PadR family transcriptional regulator [Bacteroidota bacterium]
MKLLSRAEEIILLVILKLGAEAYGVKIREQIFLDTGDTWSFASIYTPLDKLVRKKYAVKIKGDPSPERGGKSKYYYRVTEGGIHAIKELQDAHKQVWAGVPNILKISR